MGTKWWTYVILGFLVVVVTSGISWGQSPQDLWRLCATRSDLYGSRPPTTVTILYVVDRLDFWNPITLAGPFCDSAACDFARSAYIVRHRSDPRYASIGQGQLESVVTCESKFVSRY